MSGKSKVIQWSNYQGDTVTRTEYKDDTSCDKGVHRYSLLGEQPDEQALTFQTRYFEVEAGGYTTFEYHRHPHSVVIIRGSGTVILGDELHELSLHDVVFIAPETLHQFHADRGDKLGFLCVVDRYRDRPTRPDQAVIADQVHSSEVLKKIKQ